MDEGAGEEFERVELLLLSHAILALVRVVPGLAAIANLARGLVVACPLQAQRGTQEIARESLETHRIVGLDGDCIVDREARVTSRMHPVM